MPNPQQPELARNRKTPALDEHATPGVLEGEPDVGADAPRGPVPVDNQPGHHPAEEQDKPDVNAFAEKLGTMPPQQRTGEFEPAAATAKDEQPSSALKTATRSRPVFVAAVAALLGVVLAVLLGRRRRSRR